MAAGTNPGPAGAEGGDADAARLTRWAEPSHATAAVTAVTTRSQAIPPTTNTNQSARSPGYGSSVRAADGEHRRERVGDRQRTTQGVNRRNGTAATSCTAARSIRRAPNAREARPSSAVRAR